MMMKWLYFDGCPGKGELVFHSFSKRVDNRDGETEPAIIPLYIRVDEKEPNGSIWLKVFFLNWKNKQRCRRPRLRQAKAALILFITHHDTSSLPYKICC